MNPDLIGLLTSIPGVGPYIPTLLIVFGICAVVAAQLPVPTDGNSIYGFAYRAVNLLGHNYYRAQNRDTPPPSLPPPTAVAGLLVLVLAALTVAACTKQDARTACLVEGLAAPIAIGVVNTERPDDAANAALAAGLARDACVAFRAAP